MIFVADDLVDMGVLGNELRHQILQPEQFVDLSPGAESDPEHAEREKVAALKFKGCMRKTKSKELSNAKNKENYEHDTQGEYDIPNNDQVDDGAREAVNETFILSIVPIHECNFEIEDICVTIFQPAEEKGHYAEEAQT